MKVDNAIILSAGTSSRFAPLSYEKPKALTIVRGEVLIERQIRQLQQAGINEIIVVTGYKSEQFAYLEEKFCVKLVYNPEYLTRNNNGSIYAVRNFLKNSYICSSDNYFLENPFEEEVNDSYYSAVFAKGYTDEWCIETDENDIIKNVAVGGKNSWIMMGHVFWSEDFSKKFLTVLDNIYNLPETKEKLWESIYLDHIKDLKMKIRRYPNDYIFEFDTLDDLRTFDQNYINNSGSVILNKIAGILAIEEKEIKHIKAFRNENNLASGFTFEAGKKYSYLYETQQLEEC